MALVAVHGKDLSAGKRVLEALWRLAWAWDPQRCAGPPARSIGMF